MRTRSQLPCPVVRFAPAFLLGAAILTSFVGCGEPAAVELDDELIAELATLPGLRQSPDPALRQQFAVLESERATPLQLQRPSIPPEENVASVFDDLFSKNLLASQLESSEQHLLRPHFTPTAVQLERMRLFGRRLESRRAKVAAALERPRSDFSIDHARGWYADTRFLDVVTLYVRLEAVLAIDRLAENDLTTAKDAVTRMLRMTELLSLERAAHARIQAANLRQMTLELLAVVLKHPAADAELAKHFYALLEYQLTRWPSDADAWIGDRALVLVSYEAIRKGFFQSLLGEADLRVLMIDRNPRTMSADAIRDADRDQLFYLEQMQKVISSCTQGKDAERRAVPYFQRQQVFADLARAQQRKIDADEPAWIASQLFLLDLQQGHVRQAADRARVEKWTVALAAAIGLPKPEHEINPVNGQRYATEAKSRRIVVLDTDDESTSPSQEIVAVPRFDGPARQAALRSATP